MTITKRKYKGHRRQITLKEAASTASNKRKKKAIRAAKRRKSGWVNIDPNTHKWVLKNLPPVTAGARIAAVGRTATISDIFLALFPPSILCQIRKEVGEEFFGFG